MKTLKLGAVCLLIAGLLHADTKWTRPYASSAGDWTNAANWSAGIPDFADKVTFSNNVAECRVTSSVQATNISMDANAGVLRIMNGGTLTTSNTWSAVGYSAKTNTMIVEAGGTASFGGHLWIGFSSTAIGIVDVNGGMINVAGNLGLGYSGGKGTLKIRNGGTVNVSSSFTSNSIVGSSVLDIEDGTLIITGTKSTEIANYIASGKITGYDGAGTAYYDYDTTNPGKTTVRAIPGSTVPVWKVVSTQYSTNDLIITPYDALAVFGIVADGTTDVTEEIQLALDTIGDLGGGVLFLPSGNYNVSGNLNIPSGVTLRGDWQQPVPGQPVVGTVLMAYAGRNDENAAYFITLNGSAGVNGVSIWYPEQLPGSIVPYPITIGNGGAATIENITFVNPYFGYSSYRDGTTGRPFVRNVYGTPLKTGIEFDSIADIGRIETVHFSPDYWAGSGLTNAPTNGEHEAWIYNNGTGVIHRRMDWSYSCYVTVEGYNIGLALRPARYFEAPDTEGKAPNGQSYDFHLVDCKTGVYIEKNLYNGSQFSRFTIQGAETGIFMGTNTLETSLFHTCDIEASGDAFFCEGTTARAMFMSCDFQQGSVQFDGGYLSVINSDFGSAGAHIVLTPNSKGATILGNRFSGGARIVDNTLNAVVIDHTPQTVEPMPAYDYKKPVTAYRPATTNLFIVTNAPFSAQADGVTDDTAAFSNALAAADASGGGTVFVPAGDYRLNGTLIVPSGVELRGVFDIPHGTDIKGSLLNIYSGHNQSNGVPFIQLEAGAGVKGITCHYPNQIYNTNDTSWLGFVPYPFMVRGLGPDVYVVNISATIPYQLLDLATHACDRHYIDYIFSTCLKTGIHVGGGTADGQLQNIQFNPNSYTFRWREYESIPTNTADNVHLLMKREATPYLFGHMTNQVVHECFVFSGARGMHLVEESGFGPSGFALGMGVDAAIHAFQIDAVGAGGLDLINSQIVATDAAAGRYLVTGSSLTDTFRMFSASGWGSHQYSAVINGGDVELQLFHIAPDGYTGVFSVQNNATLKSYGGDLDDLLAAGRPFLTIASTARASFIGNILNVPSAQMPTNNLTTTALGNLQYGAGNVVTQTLWSNGGGTRAWGTSANWSSGVPTSTRHAEVANGSVDGPIIATGTAASVTNMLIGSSGSTTGTVTMTGGSLTSANWLVLGFGAGNNGLLDLSGGTVTIGDDVVVGLNGSGNFTMSGGSMTIGGTLTVGANAGALGAVSLNSGSVQAGALYLTSGGRIEMSSGLLVIDGNVTNVVNGYISNGWMTATGGNDVLLVDYNTINSGKTTVTAAELVDVPNVVNMTQAAASSAIVSAGLTVGIVTTNSSETIAVGNVISQSPEAGVAVLGSAVSYVVSSGYPAQTTITWNPSSGSAYWTNNASWTGGAAPLRQTQNLKVVFNVEAAAECVLNTNATVAQLVVGDNGTSNGNYLRLTGGADLLCGRKADGGANWTAIGYNRPSTVTVESGAVLRTAANLLVGYSGTGSSFLLIEGGTVNVATTIQIGNTNNAAFGFVTVDGQLTATGLTFNNTNSVMDIRNGVVLLTGNQTSAVNGFISAGKIKAYGGSATLAVDYNVSNPGYTTVQVAPSYVAWADSFGVEIGAPENDYDGDSQKNLYEYALNGNPTNRLDEGVAPALGLAGNTLEYAHLRRNDDSSLVYTVKTRTNLLSGAWINANYTIIRTNSLGGVFDEVIYSVPTEMNDSFIRLEVTAP